MPETTLFLDSIRFIIGATILAYASYTDIKTRRASNMLWVIMGLVGAILLVIEFITVGFDNLLVLLIIPVMIGFAYILFQLRLMFGGADAKAIMALAILVPVYPSLLQDLPLWQSIMPFPWIVFSNSVMIFLIIPLALFFYNIGKRHIQFPYCLLGYKMGTEEALKRFVWPLERFEDGKRRFVYMPKDFDAEEEIVAFQNQGIKEIWVTPKIPFMIPLLVSFIASFILGDILFHIINVLTSFF